MSGASKTGCAVAPFSVMAKPVGPKCNLACSYCYYLDKSQIYPDKSAWRMSDAVLAAYVEQYLACSGPGEVSFVWQGGEATLLGREFFEQAVRYQRRFRRADQQVSNALQTNGLQLDDAWCRFLAGAGFLVGLSIDGRAEHHDAYRRTRQGQPTHARVLRALELLREHHVDFNVLCTVHRANAGQPLQVYRYLVGKGVRHLQLIPIVKLAADGTVDRVSVTAKQWGRFLCEIFDVWRQEHVGQVFIPQFEAAVAAEVDVPPAFCVAAESCGRALVLEHNGDLYSCDHFVSGEHRLGNILETPLAELRASAQQAAFSQFKLTSRPSKCRSCDVGAYCQGGCPKNRLVDVGEGAQKLNVLCGGYKRFYRHAQPTLRKIAYALRRGFPAADYQKIGFKVASNP